MPNPGFVGVFSESKSPGASVWDDYQPMALSILKAPTDVVTHCLTFDPYSSVWVFPLLRDPRDILANLLACGMGILKG